MKQKFFALFATTALLLALNACSNEDNPSSSGQEETVVVPAQLKKGIWTEFDEALITSGKYTAEQLAQMPAVGMWIQGDKGYFFTYTAEEVSETVEGKISYDNKKGKGTITFPTIKDSPLSGQTVNFSMTSDETMQFEYTYEGKKTTGTCAWLCENLDNWSSDIDDEDWKALMVDYQTIAEEAGPDANIDWSDSEVEGLDEPMVWSEEVAATRKETKAIGVGTVISIGAKILGALFEEEKPDPNVVINQKLDKITGKLDQALRNQEKMMEQMNLRFDKIDKHFEGVNERLKAIANKLNQQETVNIFNNRNEKFFNPLKARNTSYFDAAYKLYNDNQSDLSKVSTTLGEYGKEWVGADGEKYTDLTWQYINYITSVQHTTYGTGLNKIYDMLTYEKYPWEHLGTGDRLTYRVYDILTITKSLFMIALYATYSDMSDIKKEGIYKNFNDNLENLKVFCEFNVSNPDEFLVCQIPGAHFVMHKQLQKYYYFAKNDTKFTGDLMTWNGEVPHPDLYGVTAVYRPEWHQAGSVKIDNPEEVKSKLITTKEILAIYDYYCAVKGFFGQFERLWTDMLVSKDNSKISGGAEYPMHSVGAVPPYWARLLLFESDSQKNATDGVRKNGNEIYIGPSVGAYWKPEDIAEWRMGEAEIVNGKATWKRNTYTTYIGNDYYAAIVEQRY